MRISESMKEKPDPSVSNRLNASRISSISSSLRPGRSYVFAAFLFLFALDMIKTVLSENGKVGLLEKRKRKVYQ